MLNQKIADREIREARNRLWRMGILEWKLGMTQKKIYDFFNKRDEKTIVVNCSRRLGKSYLLTILAIEQCLKFPKSIVKMLQPEVKMIRTNIRPIMDEILDDCPTDLRPTFKTQDNIYFFPNGSEIHLAGTDNGNYQKLRGGDCHLGLIDEAGFCSDLDHILKFVLIPTTSLTGGRIILSSTTPPDSDHNFVKIMQKADIDGTLIRKTIYDALDDDKDTEFPRITKEIIQDILKAYPTGEEDEAFRTEYLCKIIHNSRDAVVPEFTEEVEKDCVTDWPRPPFYDRYVSMDVGFEDLTVVLFAFWDFDNAVLVIEDEFVINGPELTTPRLAEAIIKIEHRLWTSHLTGEFQPPYMRVSDNNKLLINDLQREFGITFLATDKHNKDAYINRMRNMVQNRQIIIAPKCKTLIAHLRSAQWDKSHKDYKRSPDNGHYDAVDALAYLVRNLDMGKNPYPRGYRFSRIGPKSDLFVNPHYREQTNHQQFEKMFSKKTGFRR